MNIVGTKTEILEYFKKEFLLSERPASPKIGDRWEGLSSIEKQLENLSSAESILFYMECTDPPENPSTDTMPQFLLELRAVNILITDFNPTK